MEYQFLNRLLFLSIVLLLPACIKQIDYDSKGVQSILVVEGLIFKGKGPHLVKLSTTDALGQRNFPVVTDASVYLYNQLGSQFAYQHRGEGKYILQPGALDAKTGEEYFIEIIHDNKTYRSRPERIPVPQDIGGISYRTEGDLFILEVENTSPEEGDLYLKWNLENIYSIDELICHPFIAPHTCFIEDKFHIGSIPLLNASQLQANANFKYDIASKKINFTFGNPQSFYVTQHSISADAFEYWTRIDLVSNQLGTLFDPQVASVKGNLYNIDDPSDEILGYFGAIAQDTAVLFTTAGAFFEEFQKLPYCGIPGFEINAPGCCNCIELENASWVKPNYW